MATQNFQNHYSGNSSWYSFRTDTIIDVAPVNHLVDPLSDPDEMRAYIRAFKPEYEISE
jgi:hypothetical protein